MPYYSELGLYTTPSTTYSTGFLKGPYSNHSSLLASNILPPSSKSFNRSNFRGFKPHLTTISETSANSPLRRINSPKLLYHTSPKVKIQRPLKINTADIDVSVNKYRKYERSPKTKPDVEKTTLNKKLTDPKQVETSTEEKEAVPNTNIRRDRATVRLQTIHKDKLSKEIGEIKSWRDNFKPEELITEAKIRRKTPGEILKEKFLIRSKSKENVPLLDSPKITRKKSVIRKSPSFKDICDVITSDPTVEDLNPGQPIEIKRRQSRQFSNDELIKEIRRNSTNLSPEDVDILDVILSSQEGAFKQSIEDKKQVKPKSDANGNIKKKKIAKKRSDEILIPIDKTPDKISSEETMSPPQDQTDNIKEKVDHPLPKRSTLKKTSRISFKEPSECAVKDISQVEIEKIPFKQKPIITSSVGHIEEKIKPNLKAVIDDVEVEEVVRPKKEKKFRFNVTVEEIEDKRRSIKIPKKSINAKKQIKGEEKVVIPTPQVPVVSSILKKNNQKHLGHVLSDIKELSIEEALEQKYKTKQKTEEEQDVSKTINICEIKKSSNLNSSASDINSCDNTVLKLQKAENKIVENLASELPKAEPADVSSNPRFNAENNKNSKNNLNNSEVSNKPAWLLKLKKEKNSSSSSAVNLDTIKLEDIAKTCEPVKEPLEKIVTTLDNNTKETETLLDNRDTNSSKLIDTDVSKISPKIAKPKKIIKKIQKTELSNDADENVGETNKCSLKDNIRKKADDCNVGESVENENTSSVKGCSKLPKSNKIEIKSKDLPKSSAKLRKEEKLKTDENDNQISSDTNEIKSEALEQETNLKQIQESINESKGEEEEQKALEEKSQEEKEEYERKLISKRSLIQKANKDDPDLEVFVPPEPETPPPPSPKPSFVPLQSNRLSAWMHPWKKPEQLDDCSLDIYAKPKFIRGRHIPRRWRTSEYYAQQNESSSDDEDSSEDETSSSDEDETSSDEEESVGAKVGASTSSNDSGFDSGRAQGDRNKGSLDSRDSPTSNPALNPAFALDSNDIPEEYSTSSTYAGFQKSGRITPPATTIPRFRKYCLDDFNFLKVLGKGSFGKVLLAELKGTEYYYAVKCLKKDVVLEDDDVECTLIERKVLALGTKHPYLCHLLCTFQTESHLFFVMEYLNGGDLMFHIQLERRFSEARARFYGAEIISGLKFLHNKGIVYRDLKLDNILLDFDGHVRIADFGMCKLQIFLDRMADTFCGTPDYMAPEIIKGLHYNQGVDWWSFGVLLYEMLLGQSPFSGCDEDELFWSICNEKPVIPKFLSAEANLVLLQFLDKDSNKRLGNRFSPYGDIQDHVFFKAIDWMALEARQLEPPFKPNLQHPLDTQYFDKTFTVEKAKLTPIETTILQSMDQTQFQGFSYTNPNATDK